MLKLFYFKIFSYQNPSNTYVVLDNGQELLLPSAITKVPALMLLNNNYQVIYGKDILSHLKPEMKTYKQVVSSANTEPSAFSFNEITFSIYILSIF